MVEGEAGRSRRLRRPEEGRSQTVSPEWQDAWTMGEAEVNKEPVERV